MRQFVAMICLCWAALADASQPAQGQSTTSSVTQSCVGRANKEKVSAYVVLLRLRWDIYAKWKETGVWSADPEADKALDDHSVYWAQQLKVGHAITAGAMDGDYWDNVALIVFEAASSEEAESIVKADPAVRAHVFQAQVRPFNVFWLTNKFDPYTHVCRDAGTGTASDRVRR
jgi:uncharacterized protein YciI